MTLKLTAATLAAITLLGTATAHAQSSADALWREQITTSPSPATRMGTSTADGPAHRHALWREQIQASEETQSVKLRLSTTLPDGRSHTNALWREVHQPAQSDASAPLVARLPKAQHPAPAR